MKMEFKKLKLKAHAVCIVLMLFFGQIINAETVLLGSDTSKISQQTTAQIEQNIPAINHPENGHQIIKEKFIEGDPLWMAPVLICFLFGLAIVIERIISLYVSSINTAKFIQKIEDLVKTKGVDAAKEECKKTKGPIASIYFQGLDRVDEGIEKVESSVQAYGSVQMGLLEKGLVWISLFIALAPMLGFLGTVVGMIQAFDKIAIAGDISPTIVADGIKVALLTTVAGLIVAIILQIFYNLILSKIDSLANEMEDASISLTDILIKNKVVK